jgi:hypothetical protein
MPRMPTKTHRARGQNISDQIQGIFGDPSHIINTEHIRDHKHYKNTGKGKHLRVNTLEGYHTQKSVKSNLHMNDTNIDSYNPIRMQKVLTVDHNIRNHWVCGHCPS